MELLSSDATGDAFSDEPLTIGDSSKEDGDEGGKFRYDVSDVSSPSSA